MVCALDRNAMLSGASATSVCFHTPDATYIVLLPSDLDGQTAPPTGSPEYYLSLDPNRASLDMWQFHVDFGTPSNSTFTGPTNIPVAPFKPACPNRSGVCIPQLGTTQVLDSLSDRLMYRLAYRNFGSHESLVVAHSVYPPNSAYAGIRWYEIRSPGTTPVVYQQGTYSPNDGTSRWLPSIAMDKVGDIAVGYSVSSSSIYPGIRYTGRVPMDALNTLEGESTMITGTGAETSGNYRWGDYSALAVDPIYDCTFWYTNEYYVTSGQRTGLRGLLLSSFPIVTRVSLKGKAKLVSRITREVVSMRTELTRFALRSCAALSLLMLFAQGSGVAQESPVVGLNFDGIGAGPLNGVPYPDVNGAVGD